MYRDQNNTHQLAHVQPQTTFSYNSAGQLTQKNTLQFEHDAFGRLKTIREGDAPKAEYVYNPFHLRVAKVYPGTQKVYFVYSPNGQLLAEYNEQLELLREYFYFQNEPIAVFTQNKLFYLQTDALGTTKSATDQNQQVVWRMAPTAFGEGVPVVHTIEVPLRFPGQYYDAESGLHYNWHRYYDPEVGRYIEPDPIGLAGGVNLYAYANNNPIKYVDFLGLIHYNAPPPRTVPVEGDTLRALQCTEQCLQRTTNNPNLDLLITGGAEQSGHSRNSHHYQGEACDIAGPQFNPINNNDTIRCAAQCGFGAGHFEVFPQNPNRDHWHFQLEPGHGVPSIRPPLER